MTPLERNSSAFPRYQIERREGGHWRPVFGGWGTWRAGDESAKARFFEMCKEDGCYRLRKLYRGVESTLDQLTFRRTKLKGASSAEDRKAESNGQASVEANEG